MGGRIRTAASKSKIAEHLLAVSELREWAAIIPVSAPQGDQLDVLVLIPHGVIGRCRGRGAVGDVIRPFGGVRLLPVE